MEYTVKLPLGGDGPTLYLTASSSPPAPSHDENTSSPLSDISVRDTGKLSDEGPTSSVTHRDARSRRCATASFVVGSKSCWATTLPSPP
ncbi:hypothetical protein TrRE_jg1071 [Triparma retinervis]|uniref:Uncharacterized protein n=1 Tax=Triparma retinervis TaxID=2557542 RepID=A0A9W6ZJX9_9STRA|nr:hypothetical protein TrRE_jg1071 [Triparma retinervis]